MNLQKVRILHFSSRNVLKLLIVILPFSTFYETITIHILNLLTDKSL